MLDLYAPIEPGNSAAGFRIGQSLSSIEPFLQDVSQVDYTPDFHLSAALAANEGALVLRNFGGHGGVTIFFGSDVVRLVFSAREQLGCIYVFEGYLGTYEGVRVGDMLAALPTSEAFEFDDGDEMYYRHDSEGQYLPGFAVVAEVAETPERASTQVTGYCVHNWNILRARA